MIENLERILDKWNPWWASQKVPQQLKGFKRDVDTLFFKALEIREILILTGVRRCGKTTLMYQMVENLLQTYNPSHVAYMNLEDAELPPLSKDSVLDVYKEYRKYQNPNQKAFVFLDEIQYIPEWERVLKTYYDLRENVKFIVAGSSAHLLRGEYATLLTGRNLTFSIFPLSFKEYLKFENVDYTAITSASKQKIVEKLSQYFTFGGFPEVYFQEKEAKQALLMQYFQDIIERDVISRLRRDIPRQIQEADTEKITTLARYMLTNIGNSYTIKNLHNVYGIPPENINIYLTYLSNAYLLFPVGLFSYSLKESQYVQRPIKSYTIDCGLRNAVALKFSQDLGRLAENTVVMKLKREKSPWIIGRTAER